MKTDGYAYLPTDPKSPRSRILNHAIAGTIARGKTAAEDEELAAELQSSTKDRAEHVMLVDLARSSSWTLSEDIKLMFFRRRESSLRPGHSSRRSSYESGSVLACSTSYV